MTLLPHTTARFAAGASFTPGLMDRANARHARVQQPSTRAVHVERGTPQAWTGAVRSVARLRFGQPAILPGHAGANSAFAADLVALASRHSAIKAMASANSVPQRSALLTPSPGIDQGATDRQGRAEPTEALHNADGFIALGARIA